MVDEINSSDIAVLDLLRKQGAMTVPLLASCLDVTATAVRQRLNRLRVQGYIERGCGKPNRGRPSYQYWLTDSGRRKTGANFADLAIALWEEVREIKDPEVRKGLLQRIAHRLAERYADQVTGKTVQQRMESIASLLDQRRIPFTVENRGLLPVLTAEACPYPGLAESDHGICTLERMLFSELLGEDVKLTNCRVDGDSCCSFEPHA